MTEPLPDPELDGLLRGVPVPPEMLARLRAMSQWNDVELDRGLRQIDVPPTLRAMLRAIPEDVALDAQLQSVPGESLALGRLKAICAGIPLEPSTVGDETETDWCEVVEDEEAAKAEPLPTITTMRPVPSRYGVVLAGLLSLAVVGAIGVWYFANLPMWNDPDGWVTIRIERDDCENDPNCEDDSLLAYWFARPEVVGDRDVTDFAPLPIVLAEQELLPLPPGVRSFDSVLAARSLTKTKFELLFSERFLSAPQSNAVPDLKEVAAWLPRGAAVPLDRGFDRTFLWKHGVHPLVSPAASPALAMSEAPLSAATVSFDQLRQATLRGELPLANEIFVEDFLAALDSSFPPARPGMVELRTAAGPAIFAPQRPALPDGPRLPIGDGQPRLLQVQVETGSIAKRASPATYLTIAVDVSARMRWGGRIDDCRRAILAAAKQLGPRDRLAIVAMGEESEVRLSDFSAGDLTALREVLANLDAAGPLNLSEGLRVAAQTALEPALEADVTRRVVVVTGGVERFDDATRRRVHQLLAALSEQKVACEFCDTSGYPGGHRLLVDLAAAAAGKSVPVANAADIRWQLVEALTGTPSAIAADAVLRVRFNPQTVAAWRLIGNEAGPTGGLSPRAPESELRAGQSAMLLYEVWLTGTANDIATAEVTWRDAASGESRRAVQPISRVQFAATWEETALPLQAAAIAAESAEVLRESYFASARNRALAGVLQRAEQVNRRLAAQPDFQSFLDVLKATEEIRSGRVRRERE